MPLSPTHKSLLAGLIALDPAEGRFAVTNPANGEVLAYIVDQGVVETQAAIGRAETAFHAWSGQTAKARAELLKRWFALILANADALAELVTLEQGRVISETRNEVVYAASFVEWFAEEAKRAYGRTIPAPIPGKHLQTIKQPVGVCAAITPWNFPLSMITRKCSPALAAGCTVVLKPSEETPLCALALQALAYQAGLPEGVLNLITTTKAAPVGESLLTDPRIKKLSFTGSTEIGKALYALGAPTLKKVSLELGGNAPFIVFDDANLKAAIEGLMASKFRNAGQTCVCANRILVQAGIYDRFVELLTERVKALSLGDVMRDSTRLGPLINPKAVEKVRMLIDDATAHGAMITTGGHIDGQFVDGTVLTGIKRDMAIYSTEIFGPVAALAEFDTEAEAIEMANETPFGLSAYVFSQDISRCIRVAKALQFGMVGINDGMVSTEVGPFGGIKDSGIGREGAIEGLEEYLNIKFISIAGIG